MAIKHSPDAVLKLHRKYKTPDGRVMRAIIVGVVGKALGCLYGPGIGLFWTDGRNVIPTEEPISESC